MKRRHFVRAEDSSDDEDGRAAPASAYKSSTRKVAADQKLDQPRTLTALSNGVSPGEGIAPEPLRADPQPIPQDNDANAGDESKAGTTTIDAEDPGLEASLAGGDAAPAPKDRSDSVDAPEQIGVEPEINAVSELTEGSKGSKGFESSDESDGSSSQSSSESDARPRFVRTRKSASRAQDTAAIRREAALSILAKEQSALQPIRAHEIDDTDGLDPAEEYAAWKRRQINRQQRDTKLEEEARQRAATSTRARSRMP